MINGWIGNMPALAQAFPVWSLHQTGMLQYIVWTALEKEGLGASLQVSLLSASIIWLVHAFGIDYTAPA